MKYEVVVKSEENPEFPIKQGQLDFMCSIYAAINALHLVGDIRKLDQAAIQFRLAIMFMQAAKDWDLGRSVTEGVDPEDMEEFLGRLCWREIDCFVEEDEGLSVLQVAGYLAPNNGRKRAAVISLVDADRDADGYVYHYLAADLSDQGTLRLHDSQCPSQLTCNGSTLSYGLGEEKDKIDVKIRHVWIFTADDDI